VSVGCGGLGRPSWREERYAGGGVALALWSTNPPSTPGAWASQGPSLTALQPSVDLCFDPLVEA